MIFIYCLVGFQNVDVPGSNRLDVDDVVYNQEA